MKAPLKITTEQMPYSYDVGGMFMNYYFHFYDEIPGLGKVFHAGMCMDQICFDGSLYADFVGNQMDVDKGTYEIDMATYSFILHLENAGDLTTEGYAADMMLNYKAAEAAPFGAIEQPLNFVTE